MYQPWFTTLQMNSPIKISIHRSCSHPFCKTAHGISSLISIREVVNLGFLVCFTPNGIHVLSPVGRGWSSWLQMSGCPVHTGNCAGMASTGQRFPTEESCTSLEKYSVKTTEITQQIKHKTLETDWAYAEEKCTPEGRRRRGRPKETWRRTVERERGELGFKVWTEACSCEKEREAWRERT